MWWMVDPTRNSRMRGALGAGRAGADAAAEPTCSTARGRASGVGVRASVCALMRGAHCVRSAFPLVDGVRAGSRCASRVLADCARAARGSLVSDERLPPRLACALPYGLHSPVGSV